MKTLALRAHNIIGFGTFGFGTFGSVPPVGAAPGAREAARGPPRPVGMMAESINRNRNRSTVLFCVLAARFPPGAAVSRPFVSRPVFVRDRQEAT